MNSPPEALSPSPSTTSSVSPSPDDHDVPLPPSTAATAAAAAAAASSSSTHATASPKRRLPASSASLFAGRENKSRRRDVVNLRPGYMDVVRQGDGYGPPGGGGGSRMREELVDVHMVEYVRNVYGDPFDDTIFEHRNKSS